MSEYLAAIPKCVDPVVLRAVFVHGVAVLICDCFQNFLKTFTVITGFLTTIFQNGPVDLVEIHTRNVIHHVVTVEEVPG